MCSSRGAPTTSHPSSSCTPRTAPTSAISPCVSFSPGMSPRMRSLPLARVCFCSMRCWVDAGCSTRSFTTRSSRSARPSSYVRVHSPCFTSSQSCPTDLALPAPHKLVGTACSSSHWRVVASVQMITGSTCDGSRSMSSCEALVGSCDTTSGCSFDASSCCTAMEGRPRASVDARSSLLPGRHRSVKLRQRVFKYRCHIRCLLEILELVRSCDLFIVDEPANTISARKHTQDEFSSLLLRSRAVL